MRCIAIVPRAVTRHRKRSLTQICHCNIHVIDWGQQRYLSNSLSPENDMPDEQTSEFPRPSDYISYCKQEGSKTSKYQWDRYSHPNVVDVSPLAEHLRVGVRDYARTVQSPVRLVGILAPSNADHVIQDDAIVYSDRIAETLREDGLSYELCHCPSRRLEDVEKTIEAMNARPDVHGVLVFYPVFGSSSVKTLDLKARAYLNRRTGVYYKTWDDYLRDVVDPSKDVEGLSHQARRSSKLFQARCSSHQDVYVPCTALAVQKILQVYHQKPLIAPLDFEAVPDNLLEDDDLRLPSPSYRWTGCTVTIINRSEILGRPLAAVLALQGATVYSVDEHSILQFFSASGRRRMRKVVDKHFIDCLQESSIIVSGVPNADFALPLDAVQDGATVVNVSEFPVLDAEALWQRPNICYIPQIGKVTVATLEQNLVRLHRRAIALGHVGSN